MNKERILKLADRIEETEYYNPVESLVFSKYELSLSRINKFCMGFMRFDCGSPACLMGWALDMFGKDEGLKSTEYAVVGELLDMDADPARMLFNPDQFDEMFIRELGLMGTMYKITPQWAANCLRSLANTGFVDWIGTKPQEE